MVSRMRVSSWGSSPRMRGTHANRTPYYVRCGIIPAYAGNTALALSDACLAWDHPRVCGEHEAAFLHACGHRGSSPRMRGTQENHVSNHIAGGIIPAYAGNTRRTVPSCRPDRDHPRVCGEHFWRVAWYRAGTGSSPRMRGTHAAVVRDVLRCGIIPAYAGNTSAVLSIGVVDRDHPRVCGEHRDGVLDSFSVGGSSPRMRGTRCAGRL